MPWSVDHHPMTVWFDDDCGLCGASVRWLSPRADTQVSWRPNTELEPGGAPPDALVVTSAWFGRLEGAPAVAVLLRRCGPLHRLAGHAIGAWPLRPLAAVVYRWVAANRRRISSLLGLGAMCTLRPPSETHA